MGLVNLIGLLEEIFKPTFREQSGHGEGVASMLDSSWSQRCCLTKHAESPVLDCRHSFKTSACCALCFCVHRGDGLKAYQFHLKIAKLLKPYFRAVRQKRKRQNEETAPADAKKKKPVYPEARKLLDSAMIIMRLSTGSDVVSGNSEAEAEPEPCQGASPAPWGSVAQKILCKQGLGTEHRPSQEHWLHIGYMNMTTYMFSVMQLLPISPKDNDATGQDVVSLSARVSTGIRAWRSMEFFKQHLDFNLVWHVRLYRILSTDKFLTATEMAPSIVQARVCAEVPELRCWQGWSEEEKALGSGHQGGGGGGGGPGGGGPPGGNSRPKPPKPQNQLEDAAEEQPHPAAGIGDWSDDEQPVGAGGPVDAAAHAHELELMGRASDDDEVHSLPSDASVVDDATVAEQVAEALAAEAEPLEAAGAGQALHLPAAAAAAAADDMLPPADVAPPLVPKAKAKAAPRSGGELSGEAVLRLKVPGGTLVYYEHTKDVTAYCDRHPECRKTRTTRPGNKRGQGRPLGFLLAWLGKAADYTNQSTHVHRCRVTLEDRRAGRMLLMLQEGWETLGNKERPQRADEAEEEPEHFT